MTGMFRHILFATGVLAQCCHCQTIADPLGFEGAVPGGGFQILGVSIFSGYSSLANPPGVQSQYAFYGAANTQSDWNYGAQWSAGWQHQRKDTSISVVYNGSYTGQSRYSNLNNFGHSVALNLNRKIHTKWSMSLSATGQYSTLAQYIFNPSTLSTLAQTSASFDNLAAASSIGSFSDPQSAAALTAAPAISTPVSSLLIGDRVLTYGGQASLTYSPSPRLSFSFSSVSAGGQNTLDNRSTYVLPRTFGGSAGATVSYSPSSRSTMSLSLTENLSSNKFQGSYGTTASASLGRKMSRNWFLSMSGGMAYTRFTKQLYGAAPSWQGIGSASLGYKVYSHTLMAGYNRSSYNAYGVAAGLSDTSSGAWNWHRPGSGWSVNASFGRIEIRNTGFLTLSGWEGSSGVSRELGSRLVLTAQYVYLDSSGTYIGNAVSRSVQSARISLAWLPQSLRR